MYPFDPHTPPPPSPPSSPPMDPDSSPPGSPDMDNTISLNDEQPWPRSTFVNPLGGDWAQTRRPPLYERRGDTATTPRPSPRQDTTVREYAYGATSSPIRDRHVQPPVDEDWLRDMYARGLAREIPAQSTSAQMRSRRTLGRELSQGVESDQTVWTRVVSDVIERKGDTNDCRTVIELTGNMIRQLTEISRCVADLKNLVVLPCPPALSICNNADNDESASLRQLERASTSTVPISTLGPPVRITSWSRVASEPNDVFNSPPSTSTPSALSPTPLHEIHMFLAGNAIAKLPDELFEVANITILSLRQNQLREVPPGITCLANLRDLNLASNQIEYLPSEILRMHSLTILNVTGNPFMPVPGPPPKDTPNTDPLKTIDPTASASHIVSLPRHVLDTTPPLVELCLRVLLAPHHARTRKTPIRAIPSHDPRTEVPTNISVLYELIQPGETKLEYGLSKIISRCAPGAVAKSTGGGCSGKPKTNMIGLRDFDARYGAPLHYGLCPSSKHSGIRHPFYYHAEERITWETYVGRINFGTQRVPIRWRGCSRGCLDFLLHEEYNPIPPPPAVPEKARPLPTRFTAPPSSGLRFDEDF